MSDADPPRARRVRNRPAPLPLPDEVALVLQGGGALGAYQAGVYTELWQTGIEIDWVAGISIGAINAAIIAGNPPERRGERLSELWRLLTSSLPSFPIWPNDWVREMVHEMSAGHVAVFGVPGFFHPRPLPPAMAMPETREALSFYDSSPLIETLDRLVDWDLVNNGPVRLSVGAVDVESGNFRFFDSRTDRLDARHILASGALPPGLPPVEIDGRWWWDGGIVSNTPLQHVLDHQTKDMLVFQVDLFPAHNQMPRTILDVFAREKEIRFSSRTRLTTDQLLRLRGERETIRNVLAKLPADLADDPDVMKLAELSREQAVSIVHLIYRANAWEGGSRDYEFSARTMEEHWVAGREAVLNTIERGDLIARTIIDGHTAAFDLSVKSEG